MLLQPLPALADNYIWTLVDDIPGGRQRAVVVDPGEAAPVLQAGDAGLHPIAILLTHHHPDHIGGTAELVQRWPDLAVYAPADERIQFDCHRVGEGDRVAVDGWEFEVFALPGHTLSHIAYVGAGCVFCGDTLFSLGCGRMFEGTPTQMLGSLDRLAALPADTRVCCGHEYTVSNAAFAQAVDPGNPALRKRTEQAVAQRHMGQPTVPTTMGDERACNPFLRVDSDAIRASITARLERAPKDRTETFAELRSWKDGFRA